MQMEEVGRGEMPGPFFAPSRWASPTHGYRLFSLRLGRWTRQSPGSLALAAEISAPSHVLLLAPAHYSAGPRKAGTLFISALRAARQAGCAQPTRPFLEGSKLECSFPVLPQLPFLSLPVHSQQSG